MIEVRDLGEDEINEVLDRNSFGHLACSLDNIPYIVPIHYGFDEPYIYLFTTHGKKIEIISENPRVCLQVEEVEDEKNWSSVIIDGKAELVEEAAEKDQALNLITKTNPTLTPAMSIRWMDSWVRENISVFLKIIPLERSGRITVPGSEVSQQRYAHRPTKGKLY